jgi:hypothetical protein
MFLDSVRIRNNSVRKKEAPIADISELNLLALIILNRRYATNSRTTAEAPLAKEAVKTINRKTKEKAVNVKGSAEVDIPNARVTP